MESTNDAKLRQLIDLLNTFEKSDLPNDSKAELTIAKYRLIPKETFSLNSMATSIESLFKDVCVKSEHNETAKRILRSKGYTYTPSGSKKDSYMLETRKGYFLIE